MKALAKAIVERGIYAGFAAWGFWRRISGSRERPELAEVRSILLIRINLLGDLLFTLPAVAALRRAAPQARITMLVLPYTADLLERSGLVDRILTADVNRWRRPSTWIDGTALRELRQVMDTLRSEPYNLSVSFYGRIGAAFALASGASYTVGYSSEGYPNGFDLSLPGRRYESGGHESEYCLDLATAAGAGAAGVQPGLKSDESAAARVDQLLAAAGVAPEDRLVAIHPGALNMAAKRWLPERWAEVADRVQIELGARTVLVGSQSELPLAEAVRREMRTSPLMLSGRTSLVELTEMLRRADLFLGGDSGPLHLASAIGVPSVSVFGPTDPANTGPAGPRATILRGSASCIPCYRLDRPAVCWRGDLLCMAQVTSDAVFSAAREALAGKEGKDRKEEKEEMRRRDGKGEVRRVNGEGGTGFQDLTQPSVLSPQSSTHHSSLITHHSVDTHLRRILVVKLAGIGDLLTAFPTLEALRRRFPIAEISALVTPQSASVLEGQGLVDRIICLDKYVFDAPGGFSQVSSLVGLTQLARQIRAHSYDAIVLLHHLITWPGLVKYAMLLTASGAPVRAGLDDGRGRFLTLGATDNGFGARHEAEYWLEVVRLLGAQSETPRVRIRWGDEEDGYAESVLSRLGIGARDEVVAVHPGVGSYSPVRRWSSASFAEVARALAGDGLKPVVIGGPGEESLAEVVAASVPGSRRLTGVPTPRHLAAILSRCSVFVGSDSGVSHVAAAAGTRVVAVFGPSNHRAWMPYDPTGELVKAVRLGLPCSPCLYRGNSLGMRNGCGDPRCLDLVTPDLVIESARALLGKRPEKC